MLICIGCSIQTIVTELHWTIRMYKQYTFGGGGGYLQDMGGWMTKWQEFEGNKIMRGFIVVLLPNIIWVNKSRKWVKHAMQHAWEWREIHTRFGQRNLKRSLARLGNGWEDKINMGPTEKGWRVWSEFKWLKLSSHGQLLQNWKLTFWFHKTQGISKTNQGNINFSRRILLHCS
jgi:hypothetical protein